MLRLRVIDLETTGMEPPAEVIEIGIVDVEVSASGAAISKPWAQLFRPAGPIPCETMAVHHITEEEIPSDALFGSVERLRGAVWRSPAPDIFVAHNCEFERKFLTNAVTDGAPWICTYKVALHAWPDAPRHSNQVLRYWRGLKLDAGLAMPPHRAAPDAYVTAHLLGQLLRHADPGEMIEWTGQPRPMPVIEFGKHKGMRWSEIPSDYLEWMAGQVDMNSDVLWHAKGELERRRSGETRGAAQPGGPRAS